MTRIAVTADELTDASAALARGAAAVDQELAHLRNRVEALVGAQWSGAASQSFHQLWEQWNSGAVQVRDALDGISSMLRGAARVYQETEDQLAASLRG